MNKEMMTLIAFKRANPIDYENICERIYGVATKKGIENAWFWWFAVLGIGELTKQQFRTKECFLLTSTGDRKDLGAISEIGKLLLAGWYYDIEDWTKDVCIDISKAYNWQKERNLFNHNEFQQEVKHIRKKIDYYYLNKSQLKNYIWNTFNKKEKDALLPRKSSNMSKDKRTSVLSHMHRNRVNKGKKWYMEKCALIDSYSYYLWEILDDYDIPYFSLEEFEEQQNRIAKEFLEGHKNKGYRASIEDLSKSNTSKNT